MDYKVFKEENFSVSNWTGGKTKQLAIFPENGNYLQRKFVWRLSSATCELEESDFSKLPDFDRVLLVLEGNVVLAHGGVRVARLNELEQDRFSGDYATKSFGKITDYNLMVAKGNQGFLDVISLTEESLKPEIETYHGYDLATQSFFCRDGFAAVSFNGNTVIVKPGEQLVINYKYSEAVDVSIMGEGHVVRGQIFYNYNSEEEEPVKISPKKGTFSDFLTCIYLANTQFRGAGFIFRKLKTQWIDEELSGAVKKIERFYIPFFINIIGACVVAVLGANRLENFQWIASIIFWLIFDILVISPLIYFAVVPKPTKAHIKDIKNLTAYEKNVRDREMATNERLNRLLGKYEFTGKASYDDEGNRTDDISIRNNKF